MHESWQELLDWVWHETGVPTNAFYFSIKNQTVYYTFLNDPTNAEHIWFRMDTTIPSTLQAAYTKLHRRIPFVGPMQPEPSAVIKKIREMEERRKVPPIKKEKIKGKVITDTILDDLETVVYGNPRAW